MQSNKKTYTIAVMSGSIQSDYVLEMMKGFHTSAIDNNVNTILFLGPQIPANCREIVDERITENCSEQFSTIYQYAHYIKPDAVIMTYGSLSALRNDKSKEEFVDMLTGIPCLMLEDEFNERNIPSITADNYTGMKQCIEHLIVDHGYKKIAFLSGPQDNYDANERLSAYLDTMAEHNIPVVEGMIAYGTFSDYDDEQILYLLEQNPDLEAIACADDMMAKGCYRICELKNLIVGKDIAITGFDDSDLASTMNPPLTSVSQKVFEIGYNAMNKAVAMCKGEEISSEKMPTILRKRRSCGCSPFGKIDYNKISKDEIITYIKDLLKDLCPFVFDALQHVKDGKRIEVSIGEYCLCIVEMLYDEDADYFNQKSLMRALKHLLEISFFYKNQLLEAIIRLLIILKDNAMNDNLKEKLLKVISITQQEILSYNFRSLEQDMYESSCKVWFVPLFIGNLIKGLYEYNVKDIFISVMEEMKKMSFKKSYFLFFDEPIICDGNKFLDFPKNMYLVSYFNEKETCFIGKNKNYQVNYDNGFVSFIDGQDPMELTMVILFSDKKQYGLLLCDVTDGDIGFVQICGLQLGTLFNFMELNHIGQKTQAKLETSLQVIQEQNRILSFLSEYDELTKLFNRRGFIEEALALYRNNEGKRAYLLFGDLDHLKEINDVFGHVEGDFAITSLANRFKEILPEEAIIGRLGGDEIVAFLLTDEINFEKRIQKLYVDVSHDFNEKSDKPYYVEASIGIYGFICDPKEDFNDMIDMSDKLLYRAKKNRRASIIK